MHLQVGGGQKPISRLVLLLLLWNGRSNTAVPPPQPTLLNKQTNLLYNKVYETILCYLVLWRDTSSPQNRLN